MPYDEVTFETGYVGNPLSGELLTWAMSISDFARGIVGCRVQLPAIEGESWIESVSRESRLAHVWVEVNKSS